MQKRLLLRTRRTSKFGLIWLHILQTKPKKGLLNKSENYKYKRRFSKSFHCGSKLSASPFLGRIVVSHLLIWWKLRLQISTAAIAFKMGVVSKIIRCQSVQIFSRASKPTTSVSCSIFLGIAPFLSSLSWNKICCSVDVSPQSPHSLPKDVDLVYYLFNFYDTSLRLAGRNIRGLKNVRFLKISFLKMFVCKN